MAKKRADSLLVDQGLAPSRTRAQALIMTGLVYHGTQRIDKSSQLFEATDLLSVKQKDHPYVSRGGLKLTAALDSFGIDVENKIGLDIGASTGGFTDCLLQRGARKIYAVDVGYGQMDWNLRNDPRVILTERTNFRFFDARTIEDPIDIVTADVSFISLTKIIPKITEVVCCSQKKSLPGAACHCVVLVKPQFEVGRDFVDKGGIVKNKEKQLQAVEQIEAFSRHLGLIPRGKIISPVLGMDGNQEFLLWMEFGFSGK